MMTTIGSTSQSTASFYDSAIASMTSLRAQTDTLQTQISTGNKFQTSAQDPLAAAQMRTLALSDALSTADTANAAAAKTGLSLTDSTLTQFADIVTQVQSLATQAANSTLTDAQRADIGTQVAQYSNDLVALANTKDSNGHPLFGGQTAGSTAYSVDAAGNATYTGTASAASASLGNGLSVTGGVTGPEALNFTSNGTQTDVLSTVKNLADALKGGVSDPAAAANAALDPLSAGLNAITTAQTMVGARLDWIGTTSAMQTQFSTQRATDEANIGGTDITTAVSQLQQTMTVLQASQASFVKLSGLSLFSLLS